MAHVLITGGSSGLGKFLAIELGHRGYDVSVVARRNDELAETVELVRKTGVRSAWRVADVTDRVATESAIQSLEQELGPADIVVANAGASWPTSAKRPDPQAVTQLMRLNFDGVVHTFYAVLPGMLTRRSGHLVTMSSIAGFVGVPGNSTYCATKAAVTIWSEALSAELRPQGIAVTTIHPGFVRTPLTDKNAYPMPFLMDADRAARIMADGIVARRHRIDFPFMTAFIARIMRILPPPVYEYAVQRFVPSADKLKKSE